MKDLLQIAMGVTMWVGMIVYFPAWLMLCVLVGVLLNVAVYDGEVIK